MGVEAEGFQVFSGLAYAAVAFGHTGLLAASAHEEHLVGLLEVGSVLQVIHAECATTEHTHVCKGLGVGQCDATSLHATHRESCHGAVLRVGNHAIVLLHHRDDVLQQNLLEGFEEVAEAATTEATSTLSTLAARTLSTLSHALRTLSLGTARTLSTEASETTLTGSWVARTACVETVIHPDDEGHCLAGGDEVVHDDARLALCAPARLVLAHAMLQVEHGEFLCGVGIILVGQVDVAVAHLLLHCRPVVHLVDGALRHVFHCVELLVGGGHVDAATPAAGTIEVSAVRVGHAGTVDVQLIVVEALILRSRGARPHAVGILGHLVNLAVDVESDEGGLGGRNLCTHHAL